MVFNHKVHEMGILMAICVRIPHQQLITDVKK